MIKAAGEQRRASDDAAVLGKAEHLGHRPGVVHDSERGEAGHGDDMHALGHGVGLDEGRDIIVLAVRKHKQTGLAFRYHGLELVVGVEMDDGHGLEWVYVFIIYTRHSNPYFRAVGTRTQSLPDGAAHAPGWCDDGA
tara:strand:- start:2003 stop:2413 length:411 start_codon:yes stop_codon:yes gene_type:complete